MKKQNQHILIFFGCLFISAVNIYGQSREEVIAGKVTSERLDHNAMTYDVDLSSKFFTKEPNIFKARVRLVKDNHDPLFKGFVHIDLDSIIMGYDGQHLYQYLQKRSTLYVDNPLINPGTFIKSTEYKDLVDDGFLNNSLGLIRYIQDTTIQKRYADTLIDQVPCLGIRFFLPDRDEYTGIRFYVALDSQTNSYKFKSFATTFQGNQQVMEWKFSHVSYSNDTIIDEQKEMFSRKYDHIVDISQTPEEKKDLKVYDFSKLEGPVLNQDVHIRLDTIKAPFYILDFWYSSCMPCIKMIPQINTLADKYHEKGILVMGINMIDNQVKDKSRLDRFLTYNPMHYSTIMLPENIQKEIGLEGFPTCILLDRNFKLIFSDVGFNEHLLDEVSAILDEKLK
ncbi:MAG TPA: TlpA disulfide reductase family protein [Saprospiraceae bacterium]|nr:TlpA disulfide reductase family protein [Saprospiraceae bacterium]